jgi:uncharacterized protein (DUF697 family)
MGRSIHLRPLVALRLLGALVGLVALALGVAVVRGIALVAMDLRTIPVASFALIPPSDRPGLALLLTLCAAAGLAFAYGTVRLALLSRALMSAPAPDPRTIDAQRAPEEAL